MSLWFIGVSSGWNCILVINLFYLCVKLWRHELLWFGACYLPRQDVVRTTKIADVLGSDMEKSYEHRRKRSSSRDRQLRRDSLDSVSYDKGGGGVGMDEVSIHGVEWSGDGVSMGTEQVSVPPYTVHSNQSPCLSLPSQGLLNLQASFFFG